jgi:hypothetical protein
MDIPQVLEVIRPGEDWGSCAQTDSTYAAFAAMWRGVSPVPTEAEMLIVWNSLETNRASVLAAALKAKAVAAFSSATEDSAQRDRAIVLTLVDEINLLRQWITSFKAAVAASSSLANLQTRVAALASVPDRTPVQAKTAITNKIDSGAAD